VPPANLADAVLVLLGHGSTKNSESSAPVYQHAAELRRRGLFAAVREAFWKQEPGIRPVLADLRAPRVFVVPLFVSEGYFSAEVIPRELGFPPGQSQLVLGDSRWFYCLPIGTHARMTNVLLARASGVIETFPFPRPPKLAETTLFIAGHGTERNENSRAAIDRQVESIRARNAYAAVHALFLDEEPRIPACYSLAQTKNLVVVPFFISDGMHTQEDIPALLGEPPALIQKRRREGQPAWRNPTEKKGKLVWYAPAAGTAPEIADVILERVQEAAA
jgi:sirohydrochlorin cobaltochelatase